MPIPPYPNHCGKQMKIIGSRMKCMICGQTEQIHGEAHVSQKAEAHCGQRMSTLTVLHCSSCGLQVDFLA